MKTKGGTAAIDDNWRVEDDMRTLMHAKEIQRDPKRMAAVRKLAQEKMADMKKLTQQ
jgi:hypothetical protein